jgi:ATP-dependent exoDNAse (exonuclease V) alpha subunit
MKWPGQKTLLMMLVWNKSATLKNGSVGTFEGMSSDGMAKVNFDSEGTVLISKESWLNRDVQGQVIGSVSQYPLVVAYAMTSHKSQALTVPAVVVHCTNEFVPGLIYVAASRVRSADHLQMLNFQPAHAAAKTTTLCC